MHLRKFFCNKIAFSLKKTCEYWSFQKRPVPVGHPVFKDFLWLYEVLTLSLSNNYWLLFVMEMRHFLKWKILCIIKQISGLVSVNLNLVRCMLIKGLIHLWIFVFIYETE
jgi:hypothetical protein